MNPLRILILVTMLVGVLGDHSYGGYGGGHDDHGHGYGGGHDDHGHGYGGGHDDHGHGYGGGHDDHGHGYGGGHDDHGHGYGGHDDHGYGGGHGYGYGHKTHGVSSMCVVLCPYHDDKCIWHCQKEIAETKCRQVCCKLYPVYYAYKNDTEEQFEYADEQNDCTNYCLAIRSNHPCCDACEEVYPDNTKDINDNQETRNFRLNKREECTHRCEAARIGI
eukprot:286732_1